MICPVCGEETPLKEMRSYQYQWLCRDCFTVFCRKNETIKAHLEGFLQSRWEEFLPWMLEGDLIETEYRLAGMRYAYRLWKKDHPELAQSAERDFSLSQPGEWEEYLSGC